MLTQGGFEANMKNKLRFLEWAYPDDCAEEAYEMALQKSRNEL